MRKLLTLTAMIVTFITAGQITTQAASNKVIRPKGVPAWPWFAIARCEQRIDFTPGVKWWAYSKDYEGGYGFLHSTWDTYKYPGMPDSANKATPYQQTLVAIRLSKLFGFSPWPACSVKLGLR